MLVGADGGVEVVGVWCIGEAWGECNGCGGGVGISGKFFSPPLAATRKILALFRVFLLTKVPKNMEFLANFAQKSKFFLKIVLKHAIFNLSKKFRRLRRRKILPGGG